MDNLKNGLDYRKAGVDIQAGEATVLAIKQKVRSTYNSNVLSESSGIGGLSAEAWISGAPFLESRTR